MCWCSMRMFVFFFQAEDGIRDGRVTGVQTCALPISTSEVRLEHPVYARWGFDYWQQRPDGTIAMGGARDLAEESEWRSEERRVGKECRCRWWRDHEKKKVTVQMRGVSR